MPDNRRFSDRNTTFLILAVAISIGFAAGWWLLERGFSQRERHRSSQFSLPDCLGKSSTSFSKLGNIPQGLFYYGGSTVWAKVRQHLDPAIHSILPRFQLNYKPLSPSQTPSSGIGISMLLLCGIAVNSRRSMPTSRFRICQPSIDRRIDSLNRR
ncbi:MAG TPA: hypothetical protein IGS17_03855 [Oscillatoriales cyanobacterium M59_W2019_021]|nr:hypothetical protein [Oscillatoriales cyanobacterium M4454_W2019_049]HIK50050.1 hypothetical protein [Oscillatoriales cyanobacterium M59_W2019_021]